MWDRLRGGRGLGGWSWEGGWWGWWGRAGKMGRQGKNDGGSAGSQTGLGVYTQHIVMTSINHVEVKLEKKDRDKDTCREHRPVKDRFSPIV